jgi:alkylhydroperoxidase/carboxymuconolactone decarboxylase family protein YurZ
MSKLPKHYLEFVESFPEVGEAYRTLGNAVADAGPLDEKTRELVKCGISIAASLEGGTHSHARKALDAGATPEELRHTVLQALTTVGFPTMMRGMAWVEDVIRARQKGGNE